MCTHENIREVGDMPIADPITYEFKGRFNVTMCWDCSEILTAVEVGTPPPETLF